ncbi:YNL165W [Zygosaccharomyces parabailii]|uniref:BN860_15082g1_1 n=1 Tax=Zygosaccharomyces bailii (strain CLIB 213 / ATCC 58445 / CBS 680 / BCRC 21525 / NBRC 1098 / NCYC 1416 / NRRL Y-2227) TaxID=1333698 RepID=A0A8J2T5X0_ZYGB2|nr:YNL165W [Zygosaccharomyces parabailii]CDF88645.1 BN860_15082g1_1 [Zygosaccharomyces bailii CLIB 213]SJM82474.1 uncharacterized protein ZBIST_0518 [Zygosaccharomyces bailii]
MNRVRALVNNRSNASNNHGRSQSPRTAGTISSANDDQTTVFDGESVFGDSETLNTVVSEGETIGDLQRLGFVNRCPRFTSHRTMPFVMVLLNKGFFCFPSEKSLKVYIQNKRKLDNLNPVDGLGVPLFHAVPLGVVKTIFSSKAPVMKIYKFALIDLEKAKPPPEAESISVDGSNALYKYLFCSVYEEIHNNAARVEHRFEFNAASPDQPPPENLTMVNMIHWRNTDTRLNGLNLRWYGTSGFASPFGSADVKLLVLDDSMASLMDQQTPEEFVMHGRNNRSRPLGRLPIWAKYSNDGSTVIPKKRTLKIAKLQIGECVADVNTEGMINIPPETQYLTCMCMVIHEYESRKDRRRTSGVTLVPDMMFA